MRCSIATSFFFTCLAPAIVSTGLGLFHAAKPGKITPVQMKGGIHVAAGSNNSNTPVVMEARQALKRFRDEVARELNIDTTKITGDYWGWVPSRDTGAVGGHMVKRMIEAAERSLIEQSAANIKAGFSSGLQNQ